MEYDFPGTDRSEPSLSVAEVNRHARGVLEKNLSDIWVQAEVTEITRARSGHVYFKLSDPDGKAQIDAVMWRGQAMRYGARIQKGAKIRCKGRVTLYEAGGRYQLVAERLEEAGAGDKAKLLALLRAKLEAEGLFAPERKRDLPSVPWCVGVVTSRTGAAVRDIVKVISRRFPVRLLIAHAQVQGESAPAEIAAGIELLATRSEVEAIIVGRGGGSSEDLDAFNSEEVVRAIVASRVPVISAVGHEIDITLADLAADKRAATPSEAAEIAVPEIEALAESLRDVRSGLAAAMGRRLGLRRERLAVTSARLQIRDPRVRLRAGLESLGRSREALARWPSVTLGRARARLESSTEKLRRWPEPALSRARGNLVSAVEGVYHWPEVAMAKKRGDFGQLAGKLDALSPLASLERGYSVVRRKSDGALVKSAKDAAVGTELKVKLARGSLLAEVTRSEDKND